MIRSLVWWLSQFGLRPLEFIRAISEFPKVFFDYLKFRKKCNNGENVRFSLPCLHDRYDAGGTASGHYFHQDLYVAQNIFKHNPDTHIDIGSRVDGFVAHVATFRSIEVIDVRESPSHVPGIVFKKLDLMSAHFEKEKITDSLSCLHALEHFGLGRYGDPIDPDGYKKGLNNMLKLLKPGGIFYLSVPLGEDRVEFNGHRIFSIPTILTLCDRLTLIEFAWVGDDGKLNRVENIDIKELGSNNYFGQKYGLGIYTFIN